MKLSTTQTRSLVILIATLHIAVAGCRAHAKEPATPPEVGATANDFTLATPAGEKVQLSKLNKTGPVVLVVLRGYPGYQCPVCNAQAGEFLGKAKKFADHKATVVFVYPGKAAGLIEHAKEFGKDMQLPDGFYLVTDPDYSFTHDYRLRWDAAGETAYPATFVVDADGKIRFAKISKTHGGRAAADEVLAALAGK